MFPTHTHTKIHKHVELINFSLKSFICEQYTASPMDAAMFYFS